MYYTDPEEGKLMTKRCDICDSTEYTDTLADMGMNLPIEYWIPLETGDSRCNRCHEEVSETLYVLNLEDEEQDE